MLRPGLLAACLAMALLGVLLLAKSFATPQWSDEGRFEALAGQDPPENLYDDHAAYAAYNRRWFRDMDAIRTAKWPLFDAGSSLLAFGLSLIFAL